MAEQELQRIVDVLAQELGRSVVLDDPEVTLLVASRHYGDADEQRIRAVLQRDVGGDAIGYLLDQGISHWTAPGTIPAQADLGMKRRLCCPVRWRGELMGFLLVIDEENSITSDEVHAVARASHDIATALLEAHLDRNRQRVERDHAVTALLAGDPARRRDGQRLLERLGLIRDAAYVTVMVVGVDDHDEPASEVALALRLATESIARPRPGHAAGSVIESCGVLVQTWRVAPEAVLLRDQSRDLRNSVRRVLGQEAPAVAGCGRTHQGLPEAHLAYGEALIALRAARRVARLNGVALTEKIGPLDLILRLPEAELTETLLPQPLRQLVAHDPDGRLTATLRSYLDHAGASTATAADLHIHRTSLYYRLERIDEFTGLSLADGRNRLTLHLGLCLLDALG